MIIEQYEFWKMILNSPVTLTFSGVVAGSFFTLVGVWLKSKYDARENQKIWERQEITRKEERYFNLKVDAYKTIASSLEQYNVIKRKIKQNFDANEIGNLILEVNDKLQEIYSFSSFFIPTNIFEILKNQANLVRNITLLLKNITELEKDEQPTNEIVNNLLEQLDLFYKESYKLLNAIREDVQNSSQ